VFVFTPVAWLSSTTSVKYLCFNWPINLGSCGSNNVYFTYYLGNVSQQGHRKEHKPRGWINCTVFLSKED
jgi:hypothetical protein